MRRRRQESDVTLLTCHCHFVSLKLNANRQHNTALREGHLAETFWGWTRVRTVPEPVLEANRGDANGKR